MNGRTVTNPRRVVEAASLELLVEAYSDALRLTVFADNNGVRFTCPSCGGVDRNNPLAQICADGWRWHCWTCRYRGTRAMFERLVLENADALERLFELRHEVIN